MILIHILKIFHCHKTERENTVGNRESQNHFKIGSRPRSADLLPNIKSGFDWKIYFRVQKQLSKNRSICLIFIGFGSSFAGAHHICKIFGFFYIRWENFTNTKKNYTRENHKKSTQNLAKNDLWSQKCQNFPAARAKSNKKTEKTLILDFGGEKIFKITIFFTYDLNEKKNTGLDLLLRIDIILQIKERKWGEA